MQHGMGGWLDLAQQGLSPCKKYRASWRSSAKNYRIIDPAQIVEAQKEEYRKILKNTKETHNAITNFNQ